MVARSRVAITTVVRATAGIAVLLEFLCSDVLIAGKHTAKTRALATPRGTAGR
jgi:hypothetical protein